MKVPANPAGDPEGTLLRAPEGSRQGTTAASTEL